VTFSEVDRKKDEDEAAGSVDQRAGEEHPECAWQFRSGLKGRGR
jgi:hypothetical protein